MRLTGAFAFGILLAACAPTDQKTENAAAARFVATVDSLRLAAHIPGLALVVVHDARIIASAGFGFADVERGVPVTMETPFDIASVTKPISAVVALRLVQEGRLDLDRPMRRYAGFAEYCTDARGAGGIFFRDFACEGERLTMRHVLGMTANGAEPGQRFWYNPPAYSWASRPMAEVAGREFSVLVDSLIFRPSGMLRSARKHRRLPLREDLAEDLALPYQIDSSGRAVRADPPSPQGDGAAGGIVATAMDLARFDVALDAGDLLDDTTRAQLFSATRTTDGAVSPYGLGWFLGEFEGRRLAWHTGLWEGKYSALYLKVLSEVPAERFTLVLLANSDGLRWESRLDEAAIERSPFAVAFLRAFPHQ